MNLRRLDPSTVKILIYVLATIIMTISEAQNTEVIGGKNARLYFTIKDDQFKLWELGEPAQERQRVVLRRRFLDYDVDLEQSRIYWMESNGQILSRGINKSRDEFFFQHDKKVRLVAPSIAIDIVARKLYLVDGKLPFVEVLDLNGKYRRLLIEFESLGRTKWGKFVYEVPRQIGLDPGDGLIFIMTNLNETCRLYRANMDGTSLMLLISNIESNHDHSCRFAVDRIKNRIYWTNFENHLIESSDYEGNNRIYVMRINNLHSFAIQNNQLFWSSYAKNNSKKESYTFYINTCNLIEGTCKENDITRILLDDMYQPPYGLKAYASLPEKVGNPCSESNGGCQHMCLLIKNNSTKGKPASPSCSCACSVGWKLNLNAMDCKPIERFLVYQKNGYFIGKDCNDPDSSDNPIPRIGPYSSHAKRYSDFKYIESQRKLYVASNNYFVDVDLDTNLQLPFEYPSTNDRYDLFAYDNWNGTRSPPRIYYTVRRDGNEKKRGVVYGLLVANDSSTNMYYNWKSEGVFLMEIERPLSTVICYENTTVETGGSPTGYLFLATHNETGARRGWVSRMSINDNHAVSFYVLSLLNVGDNVTLLACDTSNGRLVSYDTTTAEVRTSDLDGTNVRTLLKSPVTNPDYMIVDKDGWVYVKNATSIWRSRRSGGGLSEHQVVVEHRDSAILGIGMDIIDRSSHFFYGDDYTINKYGCGGLCWSYLPPDELVETVVEENFRNCGCAA